MTLRQEKINSELSKLIAKFIENQIDKNILVTVTHCLVSEDLKSANFYISIFPETKENSILEELNNQKKHLFSYLNKKMIVRNIPEINFKIDKGEKNRQRIDQLLKSD